MSIDLYEHIAPYYNRVTKHFLRQPHTKIKTLCLQNNITKVLDMGCGTGLLAALFANTSIQYTGLDASAGMLYEAETIAKRNAAQIPPPLFVYGDAEKPPFAPNSFDAVIFSLVLHETQSNPVQLLETAFTLAQKVIILEWKPETRNLDYVLTFWRHGIERLAGKEHYTQFNAFMRQGGTRGLAQRTHAIIQHEETLNLRSLSLSMLTRT